MKIELKKISFSERNSEETNCFAADLYIDGKKIGYCKNSGQGGCTEYQGYTKADNKLIEKAEAYCKTLPKVKYGNMEWEQSLEGVIDEIVDNYLKAKEEAKRIKIYDRAICYGVPNGNSYRMASWKNRTLAQIDKINLQRVYNDVKSKLGKGEVILNTNLQALGVNL
jgi:hypothetical protein